MSAALKQKLAEEMARRLKWHHRFYDLADLVASWSKDPSTKVGCVIIDTDTRAVLSVGYNGFPRGVVDRPEWYEDRAYKYPTVVHAEVNAILSSMADLTGATLYCNMGIPCPDCAGPIIQAGVKAVVFPPAPESGHKAKIMMRDGLDMGELSAQMFEDAGVEMLDYPREINL